MMMMRRAIEIINRMQNQFATEITRKIIFYAIRSHFFALSLNFIFVLFQCCCCCYIDVIFNVEFFALFRVIFVTCIGVCIMN